MSKIHFIEILTKNVNGKKFKKTPNLNVFVEKFCDKMLRSINSQLKIIKNIY